MCLSQLFILLACLIATVMLPATTLAGNPYDEPYVVACDTRCHEYTCQDFGATCGNNGGLRTNVPDCYDYCYCRPKFRDHAVSPATPAANTTGAGAAKHDIAASLADNNHNNNYAMECSQYCYTLTCADMGANCSSTGVLQSNVEQCRKSCHCRHVNGQPIKSTSSAHGHKASPTAHVVAAKDVDTKDTAAALWLVRCSTAAVTLECIDHGTTCDAVGHLHASSNTCRRRCHCALRFDGERGINDGGVAPTPRDNSLTRRRAVASTPSSPTLGSDLSKRDEGDSGLCGSTVVSCVGVSTFICTTIYHTCCDSYGDLTSDSDKCLTWCTCNLNMG
ncbi:hypothetical protein QBC46DRAFT_403382 [Diplogelasinospora grovesii]|uniref:Uncharacterized protein n=1 Tax=Diplogelasinospora grovesii TaxID=303347 RepID=A0AAN6S968_9PEZI|nr:hypothetical protein QBC46DRAFT_403382 [Diplogelasinospora grovesii]